MNHLQIRAAYKTFFFERLDLHSKFRRHPFCRHFVNSKVERQGEEDSSFKSMVYPFCVYTFSIISGIMCYNADGYLVNMLQPHQQDIRSTTRRVFSRGGGYLLNDSLQVCLFVVCMCARAGEEQLNGLLVSPGSYWTSSP